MLSSSHTKRAKLSIAPSLEQEMSGRETREISTFSFPYPQIAEHQILQRTGPTARKSSEENSPQCSSLILSIPFFDKVGTVLVENGEGSILKKVNARANMTRHYFFGDYSHSDQTKIMNTVRLG